MGTSESVDKRLNPRSNIFVTATLYGASSSEPVRIRNMSRDGALVEAPMLPPIGSPIRLSRGSLSVAGEVVWVAEGKAGLHFSAATNVGDWLPGGKRGAGQQLADELAHQARLGTAPAMRSQPASDLASSTLREELLRLRAELEKAGEELAADSDVAARHATPLQAIDGAAQALAKLADREASADSGAAPIRGSAAP